MVRAQRGAGWGWGGRVCVEIEEGSRIQREKKERNLRRFTFQRCLLFPEHFARSQPTNWWRNKLRKGCSNRYDSEEDLRSGTDCACLIPALQSPHPGGLAFKAEWLAQRNTPLTKFSSPLSLPPVSPSTEDLSLAAELLLKRCFRVQTKQE